MISPALIPPGLKILQTVIKQILPELIRSLDAIQLLIVLRVLLQESLHYHKQLFKIVANRPKLTPSVLYFVLT